VISTQVPGVNTGFAAAGVPRTIMVNNAIAIFFDTIPVIENLLFDGCNDSIAWLSDNSSPQ
jgi:hypothetical protein